jgi:hypothetical protein
MKATGSLWNAINVCCYWTKKNRIKDAQHMGNDRNRILRVEYLSIGKHKILCLYGRGVVVSLYDYFHHVECVMNEAHLLHRMWWGRSQAIFDPKKFPIQPSHLNTFGNIYSIYSQSLQEACGGFAAYKLFLNIKVLMLSGIFFPLVMLSRANTQIKEDVHTEMLMFGLWGECWWFLLGTNCVAWTSTRLGGLTVDSP